MKPKNVKLASSSKQIEHLFNIKTKLRFDHIFNILKLIATQSTNTANNRNSYMKATLDLLEKNHVIDFKMKVFFLRKMNENKNKLANEYKVQHINYNKIHNYINTKNMQFNKLYSNRLGHENPLEQNKVKEVIVNISNFYKKIFNLMEKNKLTRLNYNNIVSNVVPYVKNEYKLERLYNNIVHYPEYYKNKFNSHPSPPSKKRKSKTIENYMLRKK